MDLLTIIIDIIVVLCGIAVLLIAWSNYGKKIFFEDKKGWYWYILGLFAIIFAYILAPFGSAFMWWSDESWK